MPQRLVGLLFVLCSAAVTMAEGSSMWSISLRGGGNTYITLGEVQSKLGIGGNLDMCFTKYWGHKVDVGLHTGLSFGCCTNGFSTQVNRQFTNYDYLGYKMIYTITADQVTLHISRQFNMEIPLMLAIRKNHVFCNIGGKFMMVLSDSYQQDVKDVTIDAYYELPDVHVINRLITGITDGADYSGKNCLPKYNVLVSAEIGYEWPLRNGGLLGLGIYADYSPWNSHKTTFAKEIIEVAPIIDSDYPPASVTVHPLAASSISKLNFCDFGLKIYYGIEHTHRSNNCHCIKM